MAKTPTKTAPERATDDAAIRGRTFTVDESAEIAEAPAVLAGQDADPVAQAPDAEAAATIAAAPANARLQTGRTHIAADQPGAPIDAELSLPDAFAPPPEPAPSRPFLGQQAVMVTGPKRGRWRSIGGKAVKFGVEPVRVSVAGLSEAEVAAIRDDPLLSVLPAPKDA